MTITATASAITATVSIPLLMASSNFTTAGPPYADSATHTYYMRASVTSRPSMRSGVVGAMTYLDSATKMRASRQSVEASTTDVVVGAKYSRLGQYAKWCAWTTCTKKNSNTSCDRHDITINTKNPHANYRSLMCHEIGHSIGFGHAYGKNNNYSLSSGRRTCMRGGPDVTVYSTGDKYRINKLYG